MLACAEGGVFGSVLAGGSAEALGAVAGEVEVDAVAGWGGADAYAVGVLAAQDGGDGDCDGRADGRHAGGIGGVEA